MLVAGCLILDKTKNESFLITSSVQEPVSILNDKRKMTSRRSMLCSENPPQSPFKKGGSLKIPPLVKGGKGGFGTPLANNASL
ncbi:MAG: hypothetical protein ABII26_06755 [Pseudomonadota bacterium]